MGIIDDYLVGKSSDEPAAVNNSSGIIQQYLIDTKPEPLAKDIKKVNIDTTPKPPISGISKEDSDAINASDRGVQGGANPRDNDLSEGIANFPIVIKDKLKENFMGGVNEVAEGIGEKSYKKLGIGLLRTLTTIPATASDAASIPTNNIFGQPNQDVPRYPNGTPTGDTLANPANIGDRAGFVAGAAVPIAPGLGLVSKLPTSASNVASSLSAIRPTNSSLKALIENIGPENLQSAVSAMKANPRLAPADLSPRVLQDTQHLFANEGPQIDYLAKTSSARLAGSKGAANIAFDASMGATVNAAQKVEDLKNAAREIGKKNIEPVLANQPNTDVTSLIKHIDSEIGYPAMKAIKEGKAPPIPLNPYQTELLNVRNKLRSTDWPDRPKMLAYTDQIHDAQIALREKAQGLQSGAVGSEKNLGSDLLKFREKMKDAVGPEYKEALGKYAGQKKIEEAFHNGYDTILANSPKLENDPSFFEKWVNSKDRKPGELEAAKEGARLRINAAINGNRAAATNPASKAISIGQNDFSVKRLETLLGKDEANKLMTTLEHERMIANTHNKIIEGSQTAMRTASKSQFALPTKTDVMRSAPAVAAMEASNYFMGGLPGAGTAILSAAKIGAKVKDIIAEKLAREHNFQYAKLALPTEGPNRDALIKSLEAAIPGPKKSLVTSGANALSRIVAP